MGFLSKVWGAVKVAFLAVPGGTAVVLPIVVALASRYGFNVTANQLTAVMAVASAVVGFLVHKGVKQAQAKAVAKTTAVKE